MKNSFKKCLQIKNYELNLTHLKIQKIYFYFIAMKMLLTYKCPNRGDISLITNLVNVLNRSKYFTSY